MFIVLTSDGRVSQRLRDDALRLRQAGVAVYVLGIGRNMDLISVGGITADPDHVYVVSTPKDVTTVVRGVTKDINDARKGNTETS